MSTALIIYPAEFSAHPDGFRAGPFDALRIRFLGRAGKAHLLHPFPGFAAKWIFQPRERLFASCFQCGFRFNTYIGFAVAGAVGGQPAIAAMALLAGAMIPIAKVASVWVLARHSSGGWVRELARNPLIIATVSGAAASLIGIQLPKPVDHLIELLASASLPMGLIAVGAGLRAMHIGESLEMMAYWLGVKLLALPVTAWGVVAR